MFRAGTNVLYRITRSQRTMPIVQREFWHHARDTVQAERFVYLLTQSSNAYLTGDNAL